VFTNLICAGLLLAGGSGETQKPAYPGGNLLIEPVELSNKAKDFRILDVRVKAAYDRGHVPGAVWVDPSAWAKEFAKNQDREIWSGKIGALGIAQDSHVVLYDDSNAKDAARAWWILRYFGVKDARLLNGGWSACYKAGLPEDAVATAVKARDFAIAPSDSRLATKDRILKLLKDGQKTQIIDTRSEGEHCGIEKFAKRGGAIPGALHLEWSDALEPGTHRFKSAADLSQILKKAGIDLNRPSITYCQSGGRAAVMAFTLELMGAREVANYYRSWSEWGNADDTPVELPKKK
jgi:thiosulfate/3-mercaptopyruvate sulfurtransferase